VILSFIYIYTYRVAQKMAQSVLNALTYASATPGPCSRMAHRHVTFIEPDVAPKQPGLEPSQLRCLGCPSADGLSTSTINKLKQVIVIEWGKLSQRFIDRAIGQWRRRLECIVQQQSGHIEHLM